MDDGGVNESGSQHLRPSLESSVSDCKKRKKSPCDVCGKDVHEKYMFTCFRCNYTRRHRYCSGQNFGAWTWSCDECNSSIRDSNESATSRTNQEDHNEVVHSNEISETNPPSQTHTSPAVEEASSPVSIGTSPVQEPKQSDNDTPSDSESGFA